jgi:hypothetical protein
MFLNAVSFTERKLTYTEGSRNSFVYLLACNCNRKGIPETEALSFILDKFNFDDSEVRASVNSAYTKNSGEFARYTDLTLSSQKDEIEIDEKEDLSNQLLNTPYIPESIYTHLPSLLRKACDNFQHPREKDIFLTGAITVLSGCANEVYGIYDQRKVFPNLYSFIIAPAASGKGALALAKDLAMVSHRKMIDHSKSELRLFETAMEQYKIDKRNANKDDHNPPPAPPCKPNFKILFIPANSSAAAVIGHLEQSDGCGIIFETEADTMGNSFKQDWGGYSDLLRKAFQHEPVTYSRKANAEFIEVEKPRISVALSGTPSQVQGLIKSAEDGLFSRFMFYTFKVKPQWRDVSPQNGINLNDLFIEISLLVEQMSDFLQKFPTEVFLNEEQWSILNTYFELWLNEVSSFVSEEVGSTVKRLGLIVFRIAMVLTAMRKFENGVCDSEINCDDTDFQIAIQLAEVYKQHALMMYSILPKSDENTLPKNKRLFFDALPGEKDFSHKEAVAIGNSLGIKERTVSKHLKQLLGIFLDQPIKYGPYRKRA